MTKPNRELGFGGRAAHELAVLAARFAAGEVELISTYFTWEKRSRETDIHCPPDAAELARLLRPAGGTAVLGRLPGSTPQVSRDAFLA